MPHILVEKEIIIDTEGKPTENDNASPSLSDEKEDQLDNEKLDTQIIEFIIPKVKYPNLKAAMKNSRDSIYVMFDKAGIFERAVSDIFRGKFNDAQQ